MQIKTNPELFEDWKLLGGKVSRLSSIVQNDMELDEVEIDEWLTLVFNLTEEMFETRRRTVDYIKSLNK